MSSFKPENTMHPWLFNSVQFYAYKSDRKNAKIISDVHMHHLITHNENKCVDENKIESYFVGIISQLVTDIKYSACTINITSYAHIRHVTTYVNANSDLYSHNHVSNYTRQRVKLYSIEDLINYVYDLLLLVYPYTRLDLNTIYNNPSIKYYINLYYNHS